MKIGRIYEIISGRFYQSFMKLRRSTLMTQSTRRIDVEDVIDNAQVDNNHTMPSPAAMGLSDINSLDYISSSANDAARQAKEPSGISSISVPEISMNYMESDIIEEAQDLPGLSSIRLPSDISSMHIPSMHIPSCISTAAHDDTNENDLGKG